MSPRRTAERVKEHGRFLTAFARNPQAVGAVAPSSRHLAAMIADDMGLQTADTVVELGPGTGVVTEAIAQRVRNGTLVLAVELNADLAAPLVRRFPRFHIINDSAERLVQHLRERGRDSADSIVSGLPWAAFGEDLQDRLLSAVEESLRPGGRFATFAYVHASWLPPARRFRSKLERRFSDVITTPVVWRNLPPAFVYRCRK